MKSWLPVVGLASALLGCSAVVPVSPTMPGTVLVSAGSGPDSASLSIAHLAYTTQAIAHSWVASDVYKYDVSLLVKNASGTYVPLSPAVSTALNQKTTSPSQTADFTGLATGVYEASVTALGDVNASDANVQLNASPATAPLDLSSATTASTTVTVQFDNVPFDATATSTFDVPASDGPWIDPSATPTLTVQ